MTARIVRLRPWWLRVPLWSAWFPFVALGAILTGPHRLLVPDFWRLMGAAYLLGIDGVGR